MNKFFTKEVTKPTYDRWGAPTGEQTVTELRTNRVVACVIAFVLIVAMLFSCTTIVKAGHTGVVSTFGKISENVLQEGLNIKAPWQKIIKMDNRIVKMEVATEAFSSDLQTVSVNLAVNYRVDPNKSYYIIKNIGKKYEDVLIAPAVHEVMKSIVAGYTAEKSIANRNEISQSLLENLGEKLMTSGIYVDDINIIDFDFSDTYITAIEAKQVTEQQRLQAIIEQEKLTMEQEAKAERQKIEAEAAAEVARINADAALYAGEKEAEINEMISKSVTDALVEYLKIEQWDGKLPSVTGADSIVTMGG